MKQFPDHKELKLGSILALNELKVTSTEKLIIKRHLTNNKLDNFFQIKRKMFLSGDFYIYVYLTCLLTVKSGRHSQFHHT